MTPQRWALRIHDKVIEEHRRIYRTRLAPARESLTRRCHGEAALLSYVDFPYQRAELNSAGLLSFV